MLKSIFISIVFYILPLITFSFKPPVQLYRGWKWTGLNRKHLQMALQFKIIEIPHQTNLLQYYTLLVENLGDQIIIRWYIAKIENETATIEVVYDDSMN